MIVLGFGINIDFFLLRAGEEHAVNPIAISAFYEVLFAFKRHFED